MLGQLGAGARQPHRGSRSKKAKDETESNHTERSTAKTALRPGPLHGSTPSSKSKPSRSIISPRSSQEGQESQVHHSQDCSKSQSVRPWCLSDQILYLTGLAFIAAVALETAPHMVSHAYGATAARKFFNSGTAIVSLLVATSAAFILVTTVTAKVISRQCAALRHGYVVALTFLSFLMWSQSVPIVTWAVETLYSSMISDTLNTVRGSTALQPVTSAWTLSSVELTPVYLCQSVLMIILCIPLVGIATLMTTFWRDHAHFEALWPESHFGSIDVVTQGILSSVWILYTSLLHLCVVAPVFQRVFILACWKVSVLPAAVLFISSFRQVTLTDSDAPLSSQPNSVSKASPTWNQYVTRAIYWILCRHANLMIGVPCLLLYVLFERSASHSLCGTDSMYHVAPSFRVLMSQESITGRISVLELDGNSYGIRFLRCDHSILGGMYVYNDDPELLNAFNNNIFGIFNVMEAARLTRAAANSIQQPRVLQIGLGIGVTSRLFQQVHGAVVDVIELDPVVFKAAHRFFGMPYPSGSLYLNDAYRVVMSNGTVAPDIGLQLETQASDSTQGLEAGSYNYIFHDVFTNGAAPDQLYDLSFLAKVKSLLSDDGIFAINVFGQTNFRAHHQFHPLLEDVTRTYAALSSLFPEVRCFGDEHEKVDIRNLVCFASRQPLNFRPVHFELDMVPEESIRGAMLSTFENFEVTDDLRDALEEYLPGSIVDQADQGADNMLEESNSQHSESIESPLQHELRETSADPRRGFLKDRLALHHWANMRILLPPAVWRNF